MVIFSIFFSMMVYCVFIEAILKGTHNIPFYYEKEKQPKPSQISSYGIFSKGLK